jgi:hypothetical protein
VSKSSFWGGWQAALIAVVQVLANGITDLKFLNDIAIKKHTKRLIMTRDLKMGENEIHSILSLLFA